MGVSNLPSESRHGSVVVGPEWDRFGPDDRLGALNYISPETVKRAATLIQIGQVIPLNRTLDSPRSLSVRPALERTVRLHNQIRPVAGGKFVVVNDDNVEFALQGSSHWDSFAHLGCIEDGSEAVYYGGRGLSETYPNASAPHIGIDAFGRGIVTRGVLIDAVAAIGDGDAKYLDPTAVIDDQFIRRCLARQAIALEPGDAVLVFTGFESGLDEKGEEHQRRHAGVDSSTLPIWRDGHISALIADNAAVEPVPMKDFSLHIGTLKNLGIPLGEYWALRELAEACRVDRRYDFLFVSVPLNIPGAFGSPANAVAIR